MGGLVTPADSVFREVAAERRVASLPLAHFSIELGHLYMDDFVAGIDLERYFAQVAPWVRAARQDCAESLQSRKGKPGQHTREPRPRISTCFLIDDYFTRFSSPAEIIPALVSGARAAGLEIDYLARESGCAHAEDVDLASLVMGRVVPDPPLSANGSRPHPTEVGWLSNGERSPADDAVREAMETVGTWVPPTQNSARRHSIFVDLELWDEKNGHRKWSCHFLAAVWQLLRLGMLRHNGDGVALPQLWKRALPDDWDDIPAVIQLNSTAAPFSAYRTFSILSTRFLPIELAVRTILSQVAVDRDVLSQVTARSQAEGVDLPLELVDRIGYLIAGSSAAQPN
ncbi:MAG: SCO2522 family protein [Pseudonocardiaceae bacterium]